MRAYVIEYQWPRGRHLNQEGFDSLEKAQTYIRKRYKNFEQVAPMWFRNNHDEHYLIHDIRIV